MKSGLYRPPDQDALVREVEKDVFNLLIDEVGSEQVGEMVMSRLRQLDEIAYIRFASVYRQFKDISTFMDELKSILDER